MSVNILTKSVLAALITGSVLTVCLPAQAREFEALNNIRGTAEQYALNQLDTTGLSNIEASTAAMDSRLRLAKCEIALEAFTTSASRNISHTTVGVRCQGIKPWSIYVPVTINATAEVVYTQRQLVRGEVISSGDLELRQMPINRLPANYLNNINEVSGMELTRSIRPGTPLTINTLTVRQLIQRGQEVVILAKSANMQVRMSGVALSNGIAGELISVRNVNSGRTIEAIVMNQDTVAVRM